MEIILKNISKRFKSKRVLDDISVSFEEGKIYGIVGNNGSGKSVLLKIIAGIMNQSSGELIYNDIERNKEGLLKSIGCSIEEPSFIDNLTALENLKLIATIGNVSEESIKQYLTMLNMPIETKLTYDKLSLGMKQKVAITQALMYNPEVLILDEPTSSLDEESCSLLSQHLKEIKKKKIIILTSHYISDIEELCDVIYRIKECKIERNG